MIDENKHNITTTQLITNPKSQKHPLSLNFEGLYTSYDPIYRAIWCTIRSTETPVFSLSLLKNIRSLQDIIAQFCSEIPNKKPRYLIWTTDSTKVFNLGLDLSYIHQQVMSRDEKSLHDYIQICIDVFYINLMKLDIDSLITISLIRGKAYGGGFEAALTTDIIVTESNAKCCFPEVKYHLLPSFGTLKMLLRKYPPPAIQSLIFHGRKIRLHDLKESGFIESIVNEGEGEKYIRDKISEIHARHELFSHLFNAKNTNIIITYKELDEFRNNWVKTILHLKPNDLRRLERLAYAQNKLSGGLRNADRT